jgi:hypothetical protein
MASASFTLRAVDQTQAAFASVQNALQRTASIAKTSGATLNRMFGGLGVAIGAGSILAFGKSVIDLGGYINDSARAAGLGTDAFQALANAGKESGLTMEQVARAAEALRSKIADAVSGNESAIKTFDKLGLTGQELKAISLEKAFEVIAKSVKSAKDEQEAMNAVSDIFGNRIGPKLREIIDKLASGSIEDLSQQMKGITLSKEQLDTLDAASDKLDRLITQAKVVSAQGFLAMMKALEDRNKVGGAGSFGARSPLGGLKPGAAKLATTTKPVQDRTDANAIKSIQDLTAATNVNVAATDDATRSAMEAARAEFELAQQFEYRQQLAYNGEDRTSRLLATSEDARNRLNDAFDEGLRILEESRSPLQKYNDEIERLSRLEEQGLITSEAAAIAIGNAAAAFVNAEGAAEDYASRLAEVMETANKMTPAMTQLELTSKQAGEMVAGAFEDAILSGNKLRDTLRALAQDLLRLLFRQQITEPLAQGIGSGVGRLFNAMFAGRANGGPVNGGTPYIVGERGPELFLPSNSGRIISNSAMRSGGGSGAMGGVTVNYNIAAGVTKGELVPILEAERKRLKAEIPDMVRRGGAYRAAFA